MDKKPIPIRTVESPGILDAFFKKVPGSIALAKPKAVFSEWPKPSQSSASKNTQAAPINALVESMKPPKKKRVQKIKSLVSAPAVADSFKTAEQLQAIGIIVEQEPIIMEANYHTFSNRAGPACLRPRPEPIPHTLDSFVFVITGVLETMEREEAAQYIRECGGTVTNGVAKKTTHALIGHSCGPTKIAEIQKRSLVMLSESSLVQLVTHINNTKAPTTIAVESTSQPSPGCPVKNIDVGAPVTGYVSDPEFIVDDIE